MNGKLDSFILGILFTVSLQLYMRNKSYIINCGAYGKGRIYHLEYTKLADSERGRL